MTESPKELVREAERGESERTPALLLAGTHLAIGAVVLVLAAVAFALYYLIK